MFGLAISSKKTKKPFSNHFIIKRRGIYVILNQKALFPPKKSQFVTSPNLIFTWNQKALSKVHLMFTKHVF